MNETATVAKEANRPSLDELNAVLKQGMKVTNMEFDQKTLEVSSGGIAYMTGRFEDENGHVHLFKAFDRKFPDGKSFTAAQDLFSKWPDEPITHPDVPRKVKEGYVFGVAQKGRAALEALMGEFMPGPPPPPAIVLSFAKTVAEFETQKRAREQAAVSKDADVR